MDIHTQAVSVYESSRNLLINTESLQNEIEGITSPALKNRLLEMIRTVQVDFFLLNEILVEVMNCNNETEIELLLKETDKESEVYP